MIKIINIDEYIKEHDLHGPVISPQIFIGKSFTFHSQGLFSEDIFGLTGSKERRQSMSWIVLNCKVIHPVLYDAISKQISREIVNIISGKKTYNIGPDGILVESENGIISGFDSLISNINKIKFRKNEEDSDRNYIIDMIYQKIRDNAFFIEKLIVISPDFRPVQIPKEEKTSYFQTSMDELNDIYVRVIKLSTQLQSVSGRLSDVLSYQMQRVLEDLFECIRIKISKKQGIIRNLMLGKRVDYSARGVITPDPTLNIGEISIPFKMACAIFEPFILYGIAQSKTISEGFHIAVKDYLGKQLDIGEDDES